MIRNTLKDYFSFSRRERNSIIIILTIIIILIVVNLLLPAIIKNQEFDYSEFEKELKDFEKSLIPKKKHRYHAPGINSSQYEIEKEEVFRFNPNTVCENDLYRLGFGKRTIQNIIKYRSKGGVFFKKSDMLKIYGMDTTLYYKLVPYIYLNESTHQKKHIKVKKYNSIVNNSSGLLNINSADTALLKKILGKESALPYEIIKYRNLLGGFYNKNQFREIKGIEDGKYDLLVSNIYIDTSLIIKLNINNVDKKTLNKHPYLNIYYSKAILKYRNFAGEIRSINELLNKNILSEKVFTHIRPYLSVD